VGALPDPGRVHEDVPLSVPDDGNVYGVPGGAGHFTDDQPLLTDERVDQRGLAGVGPAQHGQPQAGLGRGGGWFGRLFGKQLGERLFQIALAMAVGGGNRHQRKAPGVKISGQGRHALQAVHLVDGHQHGLARPAQLLGQLVFHRRAARLAVHQKQHHVGHAHGDFGLVHNEPGQAFRGVEVHAAGVDQGGHPVVEFDHGFQPIARDAGPVMGDGLLPSGQTVEQGRFAHVGASDNGNDGGHGVSPWGGGKKKDASGGRGRTPGWQAGCPRTSRTVHVSHRPPRIVSYRKMAPTHRGSGGNDSPPAGPGQRPGRRRHSFPYASPRSLAAMSFAAFSPDSSMPPKISSMPPKIGPMR